MFSKPRFLSSGLRFGHTWRKKNSLLRVWGPFSFSTFAKCYRTRARVRFRVSGGSLGDAFLLQNCGNMHKNKKCDYFACSVAKVVLWKPVFPTEHARESFLFGNFEDSACSVGKIGQNMLLARVLQRFS